MEFIGLFVLGFIGLAILIIAAKSIKIVPQSSVLLIERLGTFQSCGGERFEYSLPVH